MLVIRNVFFSLQRTIYITPRLDTKFAMFFFFFFFWSVLDVRGMSESIRTFQTSVFRGAATCTYTYKKTIFYRLYARKSIILFLVRIVFTRSFEHLNKAVVRATMNSKLEEQRYVI